MSRRHFSKSDIKQFLQDYPKAEVFIDKKSVVVEENNILRVQEKPRYIHLEEGFIPHIRALLEKKDLLSKVTVDMGAVPFIAKGADVMRPGIKRCEEFEKDDLVVIVDEEHEKPLAIGKAKLNSEELMAEEKGKLIRVLHYVGDDYWE